VREHAVRLRYLVAVTQALELAFAVEFAVQAVMVPFGEEHFKKAPADMPDLVVLGNDPHAVDGRLGAGCFQHRIIDPHDAYAACPGFTDAGVITEVWDIDVIVPGDFKNRFAFFTGHFSSVYGKLNGIHRETPCLKV